AHGRDLIKSASTLMQWHCQICHCGPQWAICECVSCKPHHCRDSNTMSMAMPNSSHIPM
ncbi:hypothetical protein LZ31DRAFT_483727, partial [Colletotrichum somersetense]